MQPLRIVLGATLLVLTAQTSADQPIVLHQVMKEVVAPQAQVLWDVGNGAMDDNGNADASKLTKADWDKLAAAAQAVKEAATSLAGLSRIVVVTPGMKIQDEGAPGSATVQQIQGYIDADRKTFAGNARNLAGVADEFAAATATRDAAKLTAASGRMDEVCESCHARFWYPEQNAGK